jgi:hypothetical protein
VVLIGEEIALQISKFNKAFRVESVNAAKM